MAIGFPLHASLLALSLLGSAGLAPGAPATSPPAPVSANVELCMPGPVQSERSATFTAQMTATAATQRMAIQIQVQERTPLDANFHTVTAPGLGVWSQSETGVKIYKFVKQVTNLSAPADFRALVHYHWIDGHGHIIGHATRRTAICQQPAPKTAVARMPSA